MEECAIRHDKADVGKGWWIELGKLQAFGKKREKVIEGVTEGLVIIMVPFFLGMYGYITGWLEYYWWLFAGFGCETSATEELLNGVRRGRGWFYGIGGWKV